VASDHQRSRPGPRERQPLVAGGVHALGHGQVRPPLTEPLARVLPETGPGDALCTPLVTGEPRQLLQIGEDQVRVDGRHGATSDG
jgi:hypothetical protein